MPLYEIDFAEMPAGAPRIVSFDGKWVESSPEFRGTKPVPCALPPEAEARLTEVAETAFAAMELRDYARLDVRLRRGRHAVRHRRQPELRPVGRRPGSPGRGRAPGSRYDELIGRIVELALQRRPHADTIPLTARSRAPALGRLADAAEPPSSLAAGGGGRSV